MERLPRAEQANLTTSKTYVGLIQSLVHGVGSHAVELMLQNCSGAWIDGQLNSKKVLASLAAQWLFKAFTSTYYFNTLAEVFDP